MDLPCLLSANLEVLSQDKMNRPNWRDGYNSWEYESSKRFDGAGNFWQLLECLDKVERINNALLNQ